MRHGLGPCGLGHHGQPHACACPRRPCTMCAHMCVVFSTTLLTEVPAYPLSPIYRCGGCPFFNTENFRKIQINYVGPSLFIFSFVERTPLVWRLHLVGTSPLYARIVVLLGSESIFFPPSTGSEPGGTSGILYVYNPARHYTCGATSSSWPYREVFIDIVPTGT